MCGDVHGVDIAAEMVKQDEQRLRHLPDLRFWHGNGYDLELFEDDRFDVVYCGLVLQHMPRTTAYHYLVETSQVLKPEGVVRFRGPNILREEQFKRLPVLHPAVLRPPPAPDALLLPAEIVRLATKAGFWVEELDGGVVVQARKRGRPGVDPGIAHRNDFSVLEGDVPLGP
jgi:SAM-dependent methyltransferase